MHETMNNENAVAIIGIAFDFPGASSVDALWENLLNKNCAVSRFSKNELATTLPDPGVVKLDNYVPAKSVLENVFGFDRDLFNYSPREAEITDPAHRKFLQKCWEVFDNAGYSPETIGKHVGVFAGVAESTYLYTHLMSHEGLLESLGITKTKIACDKDFFATRVAYKLNLEGPVIAVQTSCSTGLVSLHMACQSLLSEECDYALAGAASISFPNKAGYLYKENSIYSSDGVCRPFDKNAAGTVFGDGVAVVLLKRLTDAIADGDHIWSVVEGTAINNDGSRKAGFTAPSVEGHVDVIRSALSFAEVNANDISFVEAHGTGTSLGDAIELDAFRRVFDDPSLPSETSVLVGSVKGGLGHLNTCAGMAGLIKTCLSLKYKQFPGTVNFENLRTDLDGRPTNLRINSEVVNFAVSGSERLIAGVSSLGVGGTNAHAVISSPPDWPVRIETSVSSQGAIPISANTQQSCNNMADALGQYVSAANPKPNDVIYTMQSRLRELPYRRVIFPWDEQASVLSGSSEYSSQLGYVFQPRLPMQIDAYAEELCDLFSEFGDVYGKALEHCKTIHSDNRITESAKSFCYQLALARLLHGLGISPDFIITSTEFNWVTSCFNDDFKLNDILDNYKAATINTLPDYNFLEQKYVIHKNSSNASDQSLPISELSSLAGDILWVSPSEVAPPIRNSDDAIVIFEKSALANPHQSLIRAMAKIWCKGYSLDWTRLQPVSSARRIPMPSYCFDEVECYMPIKKRHNVSSEQPTKANLDTEDSLERHVLAAFQNALGDYEFGIDDDFLDAGGDSMLAIDVIEAIEDRDAIELPFDDFISAPVPRKVISFLSNGLHQSPVDHALSEKPEELDDFISEDLGLAIRELANVQPLELPNAQPAYKTVFLTGAAGFLGSEILKVLLSDTTVQVICLVRDAGEVKGTERIKHILTETAGAHFDLDRVTVIRGDLSQGNLGLDDHDYRRLLDEADCMIHVGAHVNWALPYARLRDSNVYPTLQLARMARDRGMRMNFISSVAVFDGPHWPYSHRYFEDVPMRRIDELYTGYAQAKAVGEVILTDFRTYGLEANIFRPAYIMGNSLTGAYNPNDFIYRVLNIFTRLGIMPDVNYRLNLTPVDFVAQGIAQLSLSPRVINRTVHPVNSAAIYFESIRDAINRSRLDVSTVTAQEFYDRLVTAASDREADGIFPFINFFVPPSQDYVRTGQDGVCGVGNYYDNRNYRSFLEDDAYEILDVDNYLDVCLRTFADRNGARST